MPEMSYFQQWTDEVLTWNPADFGGIKDLRLPPYVAWTPDIVLYNRCVLVQTLNWSEIYLIIDMPDEL